MGVPNMKTAIDKAIESVPGAIALLDGVLSQLDDQGNLVETKYLSKAEY